MQIAIASGKGGTGKTTLSVALTQSLDQPVQYIDCDVEEPNGDIFIMPTNVVTETVNVLVPEVDRSLCDGCGECADFCQFNAIISQGEYAMVFPDLCHSCGGCSKMCPKEAISEVEIPIGTITSGITNNISFVQGRLDIGKAMSPPIIHAVKNKIDADQLAIIDCPPGASCPMISTVSDADYIILVTEPTPFGLNDLAIAVETVRNLQRPFAVVINRADAGDDCIVNYCAQEKIRILLQIPNKKSAANQSANGYSILTVFPELKQQLNAMLNEIKIELNVIGAL
ncbi:ATP-binding protein [Psychromonas sp. PT13]|uniref:ATP-binding protein n=1 Tax=Psychromonas sp. PT13 TaxID=3439547 RepID=UPI003EB8F169